MDERFKTSLELDTNPFKKGMEEIKSAFKGLETKKKTLEPPIEFENTKANLRSLEKDKATLLDSLKWFENSPLTESNINNIEKIKTELSGIEQQIEQIKAPTKEIKKEVQETVNPLKQVSNKLKEMTPNTNNVKKGFEKGIHSAKKFTLSLFGIHSMYRLISKASSAYLSQDQETTQKIQSAWIGLGSIFAPLLERIANLVIKIVSYINVFWRALFGVDFLARAMSKSMSKANTSAKALHKTMRSLAGFDEINILSQNGAGGVGTIPTMDTSWVDPFKNVDLDPKVVKWLEKIGKLLRDNKELVLAIIGVISVGTVALKLATVFTQTGAIFKWLKLIKGLGIGIALAGVGATIYGILEYIKNPSWQNFGTILAGIGGLLIGVGIATGNVAAITAGFVGVIAGLTVKLMANKAQIDSVKEAKKKHQKAVENTKDATNKYIDAVDRSNEALKILRDLEKETKISGEQLYKSVQDGTIDYANMTEQQKRVYKAYLDNKDAQDNLKDSKQKLDEAKKNEIKKDLEVQLSNAKVSGSYDNLKESVITAFNQNKISAGEARDYIERAMSQMDSTTRTTFAQNIPNEISNGLNPSRYDGMGRRLLNWFGKLGDNISKKMESKVGNLSVKVNGNAQFRNVPKFDVGTNYVPQDTLAVVHKGEAIVPKKFNSSEYFGSGNTETNNLLVGVINAINNIEINPYTTIKDVGNSVAKWNNSYVMQGKTAPIYGR